MISLDGLKILVVMKNEGKELPDGYKTEVKKYVVTKKKYHWRNVKKKFVLDICRELGVDVDA